MKRTAVIDVVGLTESLIGPATPQMAKFLAGGARTRIIPAFPAVTCAAQANFLTGAPPAKHGVVGNGWYNRELAEVHFWKQSNHLVAADKIWTRLRAADPTFTCAQLFWWFNMYSGADFSITPRPAYPADGRKIFDIYTSPPQIRPEIKKDLGEFPFAAFWGPGAGRPTPQGAPDAASRWIAESAKWMEKRFSPTLNLIYLPHLDYNLQRLGPGDPRILRDLGEIDSMVGDLLSFFGGRGVQAVLLSEYGVDPVNTPIHLNRLFRQQGWLAIREELGLELLDCGASRVFAVADHQIAHIYLHDSALQSRVRALLEEQPAVENILDESGKAALGIDHRRAGDLIAVARPNAWFTYYYWLDDAAAPDFARTVDIHRKPGYDPVELFLDPAIPAVKLKILWRLAQKRLGFRMLMDVIPLDASLVQGSHGRRVMEPERQPLLMCESGATGLPSQIDSTEVCGIVEKIVLSR
jgi:predicted AlkP superfamily pyrophosphatase or phosphodiesterase